MNIYLAPRISLLQELTMGWVATETKLSIEKEEKGNGWNPSNGSLMFFLAKSDGTSDAISTIQDG
jgi:hypothetical protein